MTARIAIANSTTPVPSLSRALGLDHGRQPGRRMQPLEQRHDGDGVGRGQDRAQDERDAEVEAGQRDTTTATTAAVMITPGAARNAIIRNDRRSSPTSIL